MFDYVQRDDEVPLAKPLTLCAVGMGIGFGTCGIGLLIGHDRLTPVIAGAGIVIFLCSMAGFLVLGFIALGRALMKFLRR